MTIRAAIFDLDDTLCLERDYVRSGYAAVAEYLRKMGTGSRRLLGGCLSPFSAVEEKGGQDKGGQTPISRTKSTSVPDFQQWLWSRFQRGQAAGAFDDLNSHFSLGLAKADIAELVKVYREHRPAIRPIPGIPELLSRLRPECALGLLADGFLPAQRLKLAVLGLERFFDAIVFTEELGRDAWKPSPAGFELMQQKIQKLEKLGSVPSFSANHLQADLGVPPEEKWGQAPQTAAEPVPFFAYISDNPSKDFVAPNRLGWRTIQWLYPGQVHAHLPAPEGGRPQFIARLPGEVMEILRQ